MISPCIPELEWNIEQVKKSMEEKKRVVKIFTPYEDEKPKRVPNDPGNIMEPQYKEAVR